MAQELPSLDDSHIVTTETLVRNASPVVKDSSEINTEETHVATPHIYVSNVAQELTSLNNEDSHAVTTETTCTQCESCGKRFIGNQYLGNTCSDTTYICKQCGQELTSLNNEDSHAVTTETFVRNANPVVKDSSEINT